MPQGYTTNIVDSNGTLLEQLKDSDSNRVYKKYDEISPYMGKAFVAIEDERFYKHNGIDIQGIIRAGVNGVAHGFHFTEGASTLTQQLIKNNIFPNFINESKYQRIERKIQEQYLALKIEKEMSKEEILEAYMNTINLGQGCLGVQTAAQRYFNKDAKDLTLSECAVIAAITQSPSNLNPVSNPENNAKRRKKVLKNMKEQGFITKDEYDEAMADNVYDRISETASNTTASKPYTYFIDAVINQVVDDLVTEKSYTETQAYNLLYSGGLTINVTQDADIQAICDDEVANVGDYLNGDTEYGLDYALTIHRADGSSENYSKEQLASYIQTEWGYDTPLLYGSEEAAQEAVDADTFMTTTETITEVKTTPEIAETATASAETTPDTIGELALGLNTVWMLLAAMLVFFMQPGFALVEAGFTRVKNTANILMKNFVDFMFGSLLYWFIGFGLMFGAGGLIGMPHFFDLSFLDSDLPREGFLVFQTVFCATAATIVSGAMAERTKFISSCIYSAVISAVIYPISWVLTSIAFLLYYKSRKWMPKGFHF